MQVLVTIFVVIVFVVLASAFVWIVTRGESSKNFRETLDFKQQDEIDQEFQEEGYEIILVNKTRIPLNIKIKGKETVIPPLEQRKARVPNLQDLLVFAGEIPIFIVDQKIVEKRKIYIGTTTTLNILYEDLNGFLPVMDIPVLRIHNLSLFPLTFGNLQVPPNTTVSYKGTEGNGISFGTILQDEEQIFKPLVIQQKISDVWFGIVSSAPPALFSTQVEY